MPTVYRLQSNFTKGVLDPRIDSRTDVDAYYSGMSTGDNIIPLVQGGFSRRPGLQFISDLGTDPARVFPFQFNTEQEYVLVFTDLAIEVFRDGLSQTTITSPYLEADLFAIRVSQSADTMIIVHEDYAPRKLVRNSSHTSWTLSTIAFSNIPQWYYNDSDSPAGTDEIQRIDMGAINPGNEFTLSLESHTTLAKTYPSETDATETVLREMILSLANTPNTGVTVAYDSAELYDVTFSGPAQDSWSMMSVKEVNTGSDVGTVTRTQSGVAATEDIMSATRGWPRTVTFHDGRLWFGGLKSLPQTILTSRVADFFNLDDGTGLDDEAIIVSIDTDQVNAIEALYSGRQLQIFTAGGEFIAPSSENQPLTPSNISVRRQTRHGSGIVQPVSIDGSTLFLDRNGKVLRDFVFSIEEESYTAPPASILSSSLINSPVAMAALRGTADEQSNYVYMVNNDGTAAVFNLQRDQNITAFTRWTTDGLYESVTVVDREVYFVVSRTIDGTTSRYLEKLNYDMYVDSGLNVTPSGTSVTGLDHLEGETVRVRADESVVDNATVSSGGFTLDETYTTVQAGLDFCPLVKTMPLNADFGNGPTLTRRKRFVEASLTLNNSLGVIVDGRLLPDLDFPVTMDETPAPYTGLKQAYVHGWTDIAQIEISQCDPLPMTVTGLMLEVEVV